MVLLLKRVSGILIFLPSGFRRFLHFTFIVTHLPMGDTFSSWWHLLWRQNHHNRIACSLLLVSDITPKWLDSHENWVLASADFLSASMPQSTVIDPFGTFHFIHISHSVSNSSSYSIILQYIIATIHDFFFL